MIAFQDSASLLKFFLAGSTVRGKRQILTSLHAAGGDGMEDRAFPIVESATEGCATVADDWGCEIAGTFGDGAVLPALFSTGTVLD